MDASTGRATEQAVELVLGGARSRSLQVEAEPQQAVVWTPSLVLWSIFIFILAGLAEIGGGWLVWQTIREKRTALLAVAGFVVLMLYGVIPTLQPRAATFSRVYAVYGGVFIVLSYIWGLVVDGVRPDRFDYAGAGMALAGVALAWFAPRAAPPVQSTEQVTIPPPPPP